MIIPWGEAGSADIRDPAHRDSTVDALMAAAVSGAPRRIVRDDVVGQKRTCYLLWGQYGNSGGEIFIGVYGAEKDAEAAKALIDMGDPIYTISVDPVEWRY